MKALVYTVLKVETIDDRFAVDKRRIVSPVVEEVALEGNDTPSRLALYQLTALARIDVEASDAEGGRRCRDSSGIQYGS